MMAHILSGNGFDRLRNCGLEATGEHVVTKTTYDSIDTEGNYVMMDNYYTDPVKTQPEAKCLDFMMILEKIDQLTPQRAFAQNKTDDLENPDSNKYACIKDILFNVNKFTAEPGKKYNQLSDHWALESTIKVMI
jgi:hypothetical protein